jgi:MurNAc alpha-1-phosphate uridylyltransferase
MDALMLVASTVTATGYEGRGDFTMDEEGHLARREEARVAPFVWTGVQIVHPRLFEGCPSGPFSTNLLWNKAIEAGRLCGIRHDGIWMHVGCRDGLEEAEARLAEI